ncbi:MAG: hypothetical protein ABI690_30095 [Chloroflexota bacterium]
MKCLLCCLLLGLSACQAFTRPDTPATLRAENDGYIMEATSIAQTAQAENTNLQATAVAAEGTLTVMDNVKQQLMATARVAIPPTPIIEGGGVTGVSDTTGTGSMQFINVSTASSVRDSDGCATDTQSQFTSDTQRIYITARALNIKAGTLLGVEWLYQGAIVHKENFVAPIDDDDYCLWFNIDPSTITFSPGGWIVRLYANDSPVEPEVDFNIGG